MPFCSVLFLLGQCGKLPNTPKVILVATHADKAGCHRNKESVYFSPEGNTILTKVKQMFQYDLDIEDKLFVLDATVAATTEIKVLKLQLAEMKKKIVTVRICYNLSSTSKSS